MDIILTTILLMLVGFAILYNVIYFSVRKAIVDAHERIEQKSADAPRS